MSGYWKDTHEGFVGYIVTNFDDAEVGGDFSEDEIFLFGMDEHQIQEAINAAEDTIYDFVITKYEVL